LLRAQTGLPAAEIERRGALLDQKIGVFDHHCEALRKRLEAFTETKPTNQTSTP
jgi:hypothetical protein